jgi:hypothetical protein
VNPKKLEYIYKYSGVRGHKRNTKCERRIGRGESQGEKIEKVKDR